MQTCAPTAHDSTFGSRLRRRPDDQGGGACVVNSPSGKTGPLSRYVARYDGEGRLASFQKFLHGERDWGDEYSYWDNGKVKERVLRKPDGSQDVQRFDRRGHIERCARGDPPRTRGRAGRPIPVAAHIEHTDGERLGGWSLSGELQTDAEPGRPPGRDGWAVLAGPVELHVTGPAELLLRFSFGDHAIQLPLEVLAG